MKYPRGSEWRKWDLHVHTPSSLIQHYGGDTDEVWEKFILDLESLQSEKEFKKQKGILLENWCKDRAEEAGFQTIKVILRNTRKDPSPIYDKMKQQIKNYTGKMLEFKVPFPKNYKPTFHEIDFAFWVIPCPFELII